MNHGLLLVRTGKFSEYIHDIAKLEQIRDSTTTNTN